MYPWPLGLYQLVDYGMALPEQWHTYIGYECVWSELQEDIMWNGWSDDILCRYVALDYYYRAYTHEESPSGILVGIDTGVCRLSDCTANSHYFISRDGGLVHPYHSKGRPCAKCRHYKP